MTSRLFKQLIDNQEDFTITAETFSTAGNIPLKWEPLHAVVERTMTFHSTRRAEIFRVLQGMLNVLYCGLPMKARVRLAAMNCFASHFPFHFIFQLASPFTFYRPQKCQWSNIPEAVAALDAKVHPGYEQQAAATQCFEAKFIIHALEHAPVGTYCPLA